MFRSLFSVKDLSILNQKFYLAILWITFGILISSLEEILKMNFAIVRYILMSIALYYFISFIYHSKKRINFWTISFFAWTVVIISFSVEDIIRGDRDYILVKKILSGELTLFVIPLLSFCVIDFELLKKLLRFLFASTILGCFLVPLSPFFFKVSDIFENSNNGFEVISRIFTASGSIIALTFAYHKSKVNVIVFISILISLVIFLILARRNMVVYYLTVLFFSSIMLVLSKNFQLEYKLMLIGLTVFVIGIFLVLFFQNIEMFSLVTSRFGSGFDSRRDIIDEFIRDFSYTPTDWYTGRGVFGSFQTRVLFTNNRTGSRDGIENGYLLYILKGGGIYLGFIVLFSLRAVFTGLFLSRNMLCKACSFLIIIYFIDMVGYGIPENHMKFIMVWVAIAVCNNKTVVNTSEREVKKLIGIH
jgi:hypothetical protein